MTISFRNGFYAGLLLAAIVGIYLADLWRSENQIRLHSEHFLASIEGRNWKAMGEFVAEDYQDRWNHNRAVLLERTRDVFRFVRTAHLAIGDAEVAAQGGEGSWKGKITISGSGEFVAVLQERVNALPSPFELHWRRRSSKPWDWKLVRIENKALEIPESAL